MRRPTLLLAALLLAACGTEPTVAVLDFRMEFETIHREGYYFRITPTQDGLDAEWAEVLATGWCLEVSWRSLWIESVDRWDGVMGGQKCGSPIQNPGTDDMAIAYISHPVIDFVANWIVVQVRVKGEGSHDRWHECWFHEDGGFSTCKEPPPGFEPQTG